MPGARRARAGPSKAEAERWRRARRRVQRAAASGDDGWFDLTVSAAGCTARVAVADGGGSSEPRLPDNGGERGVLTGGRGLRIVDALADGWGHGGDELGRVVWFEVTGKPAD